MRMRMRMRMWQNRRPDDRFATLTSTTKSLVVVRIRFGAVRGGVGVCAPPGAPRGAHPAGRPSTG
jgi:hypothetical protein